MTGSALPHNSHDSKNIAGAIQLITTTRADIFAIARKLANVMHDSKGMLIEVNGMGNGGKSIFRDELRVNLLGAKAAMTGEINHDAHWVQQSQVNGERATGERSYHFLDLSQLDGYSWAPDKSHEFIDVERQFLSMCRPDGFTVIQNRHGAYKHAKDPASDILIWMESMRGQNVHDYPPRYHANHHATVLMGFYNQSLPCDDNPDWCRYLEIEITAGGRADTPDMHRTLSEMARQYAHPADPAYAAALREYRQIRAAAVRNHPFYSKPGSAQP